MNKRNYSRYLVHVVFKNNRYIRFGFESSKEKPQDSHPTMEDYTTTKAQRGS